MDVYVAFDDDCDWDCSPKYLGLALSLEGALRIIEQWWPNLQQDKPGGWEVTGPHERDWGIEYAVVYFNAKGYRDKICSVFIEHLMDE